VERVIFKSHRGRVSQLRRTEGQGVSHPQDADHLKTFLLPVHPSERESRRLWIFSPPQNHAQGKETLSGRSHRRAGQQERESEQE
jgi:hypothetical protein